MVHEFKSIRYDITCRTFAKSTKKNHNTRHDAYRLIKSCFGFRSLFATVRKPVERWTCKKFCHTVKEKKLFYFISFASPYELGDQVLLWSVHFFYWSLFAKQRNYTSPLTWIHKKKTKNYCKITAKMHTTTRFAHQTRWFLQRLQFSSFATSKMNNKTSKNPTSSVKRNKKQQVQHGSLLWNTMLFLWFFSSSPCLTLKDVYAALPWTERKTSTTHIYYKQEQYDVHTVSMLV